MTLFISTLSLSSINSFAIATVFEEVPPELTSIISTPIFFNFLQSSIESSKTHPPSIQSVNEILKHSTLLGGQTFLTALATSNVN